MGALLSAAATWLAILYVIRPLGCAPKMQHLTAELDLYSGRPNPRFVLSDAESRQVMTTIASAREGPCPTPPGLGYRGVVLYNHARRVEVRLLDGRISIESNDQQRCVIDTAELEKSLRARLQSMAGGPR